jgi:Curlin associated repeat
MKHRLPLLILTLLAAMPAFGPVQAQSVASITTDGTDQRVMIDQTYARQSTVTVNQIGRANSLSLVQSGRGHEADVTAQGTFNELSLLQSGNGSNRAEITLGGSDNTGSVVQNSGLAGANELEILQSGNANYFSVRQDNTGALVNTLVLNQSGTSNVAELAQNGSDNRLQLSQTNNDNFARLTQNGNGLSLSIDQVGGASVTITQTGGH